MRLSGAMDADEGVAVAAFVFEREVEVQRYPAIALGDHRRPVGQHGYRGARRSRARGSPPADTADRGRQDRIDARCAMLRRGSGGPRRGPPWPVALRGRAGWPPGRGSRAPRCPRTSPRGRRATAPRCRARPSPRTGRGRARPRRAGPGSRTAPRGPGPMWAGSRGRAAPAGGALCSWPAITRMEGQSRPSARAAVRRGSRPRSRPRRTRRRCARRTARSSARCER